MFIKLSIIVPTLNESKNIVAHLQHLQDWREQAHEVIVVDGGSQDNTAILAQPLCDQLIHCTKSARSTQMNLAAQQATGEYLLFLHADTYLPQNMEQLFTLCASRKAIWGHFDTQLSGKLWQFRIIEYCMNRRSKITGIATGDQAIFINKALFEQISGYPEILLMEDIAISKRLAKITPPVYLKLTVISSSRRWEENGIIKTILKMWAMRALYFFRFNPNKLAQYYYHE